jgi:hypothetical protein
MGPDVIRSLPDQDLGVIANGANALDSCHRFDSDDGRFVEDNPFTRNIDYGVRSTEIHRHPA